MNEHLMPEVALKVLADLASTKPGWRPEPGVVAQLVIAAREGLKLEAELEMWRNLQTETAAVSQKRMVDLSAALADNAELVLALKDIRYAVSSNYEGVGEHVKAEQMANASNIASINLAKPHPGAAMAQELAYAKRRVAELEDWTDLMVDEFQRIRACVINTTRNMEIIGLCDRAVTNIKQRVPVIEQRDAAVRRRDQDYFELVDARLLLQALNAAKLGINYDCQGGCVFCLADYGIDVDTDRSQTLTLPVTFEAIVSALGGTLAIARAVADAEKGEGR